MTLNKDDINEFFEAGLHIIRSMLKKGHSRTSTSSQKRHYWTHCHAFVEDFTQKRRIIKGFERIADGVAEEDPSSRNISFGKWGVHTASHNNFKGLDQRYARIIGHQECNLNSEQHHRKKCQMVSQFHRNRLQQHTRHQSAELNRYVQKVAESHVEKVANVMNEIIRQPIFN